MNNYDYQSLAALVTYQPGQHDRMVSKDDSNLYRMLNEFKRAARTAGDMQLVDAADDYQDILIARI